MRKWWYRLMYRLNHRHYVVGWDPATEDGWSCVQLWRRNDDGTLTLVFMETNR